MQDQMQNWLLFRARSVSAGGHFTSSLTLWALMLSLARSGPREANEQKSA